MTNDGDVGETISRDACSRDGRAGRRRFCFLWLLQQMVQPVASVVTQSPYP